MQPAPIVDSFTPVGDEPDTDDEPETTPAPPAGEPKKAPAPKGPQPGSPK
jgi:hypothetical protein